MQIRELKAVCSCTLGLLPKVKKKKIKKCKKYSDKSLSIEATLW